MLFSRKFRTFDLSAVRAGRVFAGVLLCLAAMTAPASETGDALALPQDAWRLVTDGVMGGVSSGQLNASEIEGRVCQRLQGQVSTANNGGFIQAAQDIPEGLASGLDAYTGVRVSLRGNAERYNIHLRTSDLWLPWQSFRTEVATNDLWQTFELPFEKFEGYKTRAALRPERLRRIGIVAIGREFDADVCIGEVAFYR